MYKVTVQTLTGNEVNIYYPGDKDYALIDAKLTYDIGLAGEFNFTIPVTNPSYNQIVYDSIITIYKNGVEFWRGDIRNIKTRFDKSLEVYCLEDLAWLGDEPLAMNKITNQTYSQRFSAVIAVYNSNQANKREFEVGQLTAVSASGSCLWVPEYGMSLLDGLRKFIAGDNGYLKVRRVTVNGNLTRYIDIVTLADYGKQSSQTIEFGSNLLDYAKVIDATGIVNALYPYGAESEFELYDEIMLRLEGSYIQNNDSIAAYGRRAKAVIFETDDLTTLNNLASAYLTRYSQPHVEIEITAVDLGVLGVVDDFAIGDSIKVYAPIYAINQRIYITNMEVDLLNPASNQIKLTDVLREVSLTSQVISQGTEIKEIRTPASVLDEAKRNAWAIFEGDNGGIVTFEVNGSEQIVGIHIANNLDIDQATKAWGWNLNGLVYMHRDHPTDNWQIGIAMNMNGEIVADYITTGTLNADLIKTGTFNAALAEIININADNINAGHLSASRIQGDTLTLGGLNNTNGQMVVKDASGITIVTANNDGITTTHLIATDNSEFGNLKIDKKNVHTPVGEQLMSYIYGDGWIEYWYEEFETLSKNQKKVAYFSPYYDGWADGYDVNVQCYCNEITYADSHETTEIFRVVLARWTGTSWSNVDTLNINMNGDDLHDKDTWFSGFTANDKTIYRLTMTIYHKSWAEDYFIDVCTDYAHAFELNPYEITGSFRGHLEGSANLYSLSVNDVTISKTGTLLFDDEETRKSYTVSGDGFESSDGQGSSSSTDGSVKIQSDTYPSIYIKKANNSNEYINIHTENPLISVKDDTYENINISKSHVQTYSTSSNYIDIDTDPYIHVYNSSDDYISITDAALLLQLNSSSYCKFSRNLVEAERSGTSYYITWTQGSDERIKTDIESLDAELSRKLIDATETKKFRYKNEEGKHYGMIAQEARKVLNDLGETDAELEYHPEIENENIPDYRAIHYEEYIPHLINYVKDLRAEITALKNIINTLKEDK